MPQNVGPKAESAQYHGPPVRPTGPGDPGNSHAAREFGGYAGSAAGQIVGKMIGLQDGARGGLGRVGKELGEMVGDVVDTVLDPRYEAAPPPGEPGGMSMSPGMSVDPNTLGWGGSSVDHGDPQMSVDPGHTGPPMSVDPGSIGWGGSSHAPPGMSVDPSAAGWGGMSHAADGPMSVDPGGHHDPGVSNATGAPADHGQADAGVFAH